MSNLCAAGNVIVASMWGSYLDLATNGTISNYLIAHAPMDVPFFAAYPNVCSCGITLLFTGCFLIHSSFCKVAFFNSLNSKPCLTTTHLFLLLPSCFGYWSKERFITDQCPDRYQYPHADFFHNLWYGESQLAELGSRSLQGSPSSFSTK